MLIHSFLLLVWKMERFKIFFFFVLFGGSELPVGVGEGDEFSSLFLPFVFFLGGGGVWCGVGRGEGDCMINLIN